MSHAEAAEHQTPGVKQREEQIQRILHSVTFRNATTLQQLFQFLAAKTVTGAPELLKEYTIGVEALGRKSDFDPKTDPIVRVQSHRLRVKLKEYYDAEGSRDPILIQIPKGHYLPTFEISPAPARQLNQHVDHRSAYDSLPVKSVDEDGSSEHETAESRPLASSNFRRESLTTLVLIAAFAAIFAIAGFWLGARNASKAVQSSNTLLAADPAHPDSVKVFWAAFVGDDLAPVIAYPDAVFLLDDSNDLFRFRKGASDNRGVLVDPHLARQFASNPDLVAKAGQLYYENGYTGTGELEGVGMLAGLFGRMGITPTIKSSRDVTPDDLKQHNVILLGSPFQNIAVAQLIPSADFTFKNPDSRHEQWRAQIVNSLPRKGEQTVYDTERDASTHELKADYGLITIAPGVVPGRHIAILGGLDTTGTQGSTLFVTSAQSVDELVRSLSSIGIKPTGVPAFQALVRVRLAKGYQVLGADLTTVHPLSAPISTFTNKPASPFNQGSPRK